MESRKHKATSTEPKQQSLLLALPAELVSSLFDWLPLLDLLSLACTCRVLSLTINDDGHWRRRARRTFDCDNDVDLLRFTPQRTWRSLCMGLLLPPKQLSVCFPPRISPLEFPPSVAWLDGRLYLGGVDPVAVFRMPVAMPFDEDQETEWTYYRNIIRGDLAHCVVVDLYDDHTDESCPVVLVSCFTRGTVSQRTSTTVEIS
eukprot:TRINITY_DN6546_c0_g1_i3.p1 TRINITY_DN6546_c0_g1~~TRINITY_DN6546_c0_g1_i3.p1  ORF type:complete len:202 (-),score=32.07 TRINITY_DN6546_c0_g1_i3:270-875(-)